MISLSVICFTLLSDVESTGITSQGKYESISNQSNRSSISRSLHLLLLIHIHVGINLKTVTQNLWVTLWIAVSTNYKDVSIWCLGWCGLHRDGWPVFLPFELFLAETFQFKIQEVDVWSVRLDVINGVLVLVSISWSHRHSWGVKRLSRGICNSVSSLHKFCTIS